MLTGASGDGKSSLIYAGIIPNARSGFLKSKYYTVVCSRFQAGTYLLFRIYANRWRSNWTLPIHFTVQSELNHGFSALVDLYRNSKRYIDTQSVAWHVADDKAKSSHET